MESPGAHAGALALLLPASILAKTHSISPDHWFPFVVVGRANNRNHAFGPSAWIQEGQSSSKERMNSSRRF